jgi:hypothetical protein
LEKPCKKKGWWSSLPQALSSNPSTKKKKKPQNKTSGKSQMQASENSQHIENSYNSTQEDSPT